MLIMESVQHAEGDQRQRVRLVVQCVYMMMQKDRGTDITTREKKSLPASLQDVQDYRLKASVLTAGKRGQKNGRMFFVLDALRRTGREVGTHMQRSMDTIKQVYRR